MNCGSTPLYQDTISGASRSPRVDLVFCLWQCDKKNPGWREGRRGVAIVINGLWSIKFGNGGNGGSIKTLYFTGL